MWESFMHLLFPRVCLICGEVLMKEENVMCLRCYLSLPSFKYPVEQVFVRQGLEGRIPFNSVYSWLRFNKGGMVQELLHNIKYGGDEHPARWAGRKLAEKWQLQNDRDKFDVMVPVPLHPVKRELRGYNQSEEIAMGFVEEAQVDIYPSALLRKVHSESNTKSNRWERSQKMKEVFVANPKVNLKGKRVAIVDDVLTTGATIEACSRILLEESVKEIHVITLARA